MARKKNQKAQPRKDSPALERRGLENVSTSGISPFSFMKRFGEEMDRLFGDFSPGRNWIPPALAEVTGANWAPQVEMFERDNNLVVRADLPGMTKDDVKLELTDDGISIEGERRDENEEHGDGFYRSERTYGKFFRRLPLPEGVKADNASATFRDGVLEVTMEAPRHEQRKPRTLEIQGETAKARAKTA